jgi:hypothetical protein
MDGPSTMTVSFHVCFLALSWLHVPGNWAAMIGHSNFATSLPAMYGQSLQSFAGFHFIYLGVRLLLIHLLSPDSTAITPLV